jgi:homoserine kinase
MRTVREETTEILVPASIANLGPGFDTLAVALQLYLKLRVRREENGGLQFDFVGRTLQGENYIERAFRFLARQNGMEVPSLSIEVHSDIPMRSGLGSSAAATVAGIRLYEAVFGRVPPQAALNVACILEGHPDNAAAALFGGLTGSCQLPDNSTYAMSFPWPEELQAVVATPEYELQTSVSRGVLPQRISQKDAVFNLQRVVLLMHSLQNGDFALLKEALRDRWHQPFRQRLVPGLEQALGIDHPNVLGVCLCGAGPSVVAFARERLGEVEKVMEDVFREAGVGYQIRRLKVHPANVSASMSLPVLTYSTSL